jgi:hypothetical protein
MLVREILFSTHSTVCRCAKAAGFLLGAIGLLLFASGAFAKTKSASVLDSDYAAALSAADHFLQAWQSGDIETGTAMLTAHAKQNVSRDDLDQFFSDAEPKAYEVERGKLVQHGRYEIPVVLVDTAARETRVHRRFSSIVVVNSGNNDWAVDKLP